LVRRKERVRIEQYRSHFIAAIRLDSNNELAIESKLDEVVASTPPVHFYYSVELGRYLELIF
jgi:hypothetical protein